jgi:hypothetical protein
MPAEEIQAGFGQSWATDAVAHPNPTGSPDHYKQPGSYHHPESTQDYETRMDRIWDKFDPNEGPAEMEPL